VKKVKHAKKFSRLIALLAPANIQKINA